jgi:MOSC domain-containing protein YiiM
MPKDAAGALTQRERLLDQAVRIVANQSANHDQLHRWLKSPALLKSWRPMIVRTFCQSS